MEKETAKKLIETYIEGWKTGNLNLLLSVLHDKIEIKESTGAVYHGKETLKRWFTDWYKGTNEIIYWDIYSFGFDTAKSAAFLEWKFKCRFEEEDYDFEGSSIIYFKNELIFKVNEYEMKLKKFFPYS